MIEYYRLEDGLNICHRLHHKWRAAGSGYQYWLIKRNIIPRDIELLDMGCGSGKLIYKLLSCGFTYKKISLLDISERLIAEARQTLKGYDSIFYYCDDCEHLTFSEYSYDCVLMLFLIYHLNNPTDMIRRAFKWLKQGGMLVFSVIPKKARPEIAAYEDIAIKEAGICYKDIEIINSSEDYLDKFSAKGMKVEDILEYRERCWIYNPLEFKEFYTNSLNYFLFSRLHSKQLADRVAARICELVAKDIDEKRYFSFTFPVSTVVLRKDR